MKIRLAGAASSKAPTPAKAKTKGGVNADGIPNDPRERGVWHVRQETARVIACVDHAKRYASTADLDMIATVLHCTYLLIDARKDSEVDKSKL